MFLKSVVFLTLFALCNANLQSFSTYDEHSLPVSYGASSYSNWYSMNGNRRVQNDRDTYKHSDSRQNPNKEQEWDRVDKHIYLHILPLNNEEVKQEDQSVWNYGEVKNKNNQAKESQKQKIVQKDYEKLETFEDEHEHKQWDRSDVDKKVTTKVDKHIYLHVLSPHVNQVTVKHPVYTPKSPQPPVNPQRYPKKSIPAVPVIPVIPLEPEIYLVRKTRAQTKYPFGQQKQTPVTLKPDVFYV